MALKLVYDPTDGRLLGAQAVGADGVDKRIDVLATAARAGLTAPELADPELAYAPPFGSAKDPVNMLGYIAKNLDSGASRTLQWHALDAALDEGAVLVDVRTAAEHQAGHVPGSRNIPLDELRHRHRELPPGPLVLYCAVGMRAHTALRLLTELGHDVTSLDGGFRTWRAGREVTTAVEPASDEAA